MRYWPIRARHYSLLNFVDYSFFCVEKEKKMVLDVTVPIDSVRECPGRLSGMLIFLIYFSQAVILGYFFLKIGMLLMSGN